MRTKILKVAVSEKPQVIWGLPSRTPPDSHSANQKSPPCSARKLKVSIVKYAESVFHNKGLFFRGKHYNQGVLSHVEEFLPSHSFPVTLEWGGSCTNGETQDNKRLRFNHKIKEHSSQTILPHQLDSSKQQRIINDKTERTRHSE